MDKSQSINEIDKKLKEVNQQIKRENAHFKKTKKLLDKVTIKQSKKKK
ncbi:MAG: hypothetical protein IJX26_03290 [Clostridia bacterium]|nr:hypothetical protein [Clostridia bacterium]